MKHLESSPDPESQLKTPVMTIFIKAKRFKDEGPPVTIPELPQISAPSSPKNFPTPKKYLKTRHRQMDPSMWESKLSFKHTSDCDTFGFSRNEFTANAYSNSDLAESVVKKYTIFPSSFKVKKVCKTANSVYYPVSPERLILSQMKENGWKKREFKNEKTGSSTPTPQSRKPSYISKNSYKANFFSSKIDKVLSRYKTNSTKSSAKKIVTF
jgi:hypothetical protein